MADIDFLPAKLREDNAQRKKQFWRGLVVAAFAVLLAVAAAVLDQRRRGVEADLLSTTGRHETVLALAQKLAKEQEETGALASRADLVAYLEHPWPRTQIMAAVLKDLPKTVAIERLHIFREIMRERSDMPREPAPSSTAATGEELLKLNPAKRDMARLREEIDGSDIIVALDGVTRDAPALHRYLSSLGESPLLATAELVSIENAEGRAGQSQFRLRLVVRPSHAQSDGAEPKAAITESFKPEPTATEAS